MNRSIVKYFFLPLLLVFTFFKIVKQPNYNWDVVFYVGTLFKGEGKSISESRLKMIKTFEQQEFVDYKDIYPQTKYGRDVFFNDKSYEEQFAFYDIRVLYNSITQLFYKIGFNPVLSVYLNSALSAGICMLLFYFYVLYKIDNPLFAFFLCLYLFYQEAFKYSVTSSPDSLSTLFVLLFIISLLENKFYYFILFGCLAMLSRTDNIILISLISVFTILINFGKGKIQLFGIIMILMSSILYFGLNTIYNNAGYRVLFYHTFIEHQSFPLSQAKEASNSDLWKYFKKNIPMLVSPVIYLGLIYVFNNSIEKIKNNMNILVIIISVGITYYLKQFLFPTSDPRFVFQYEIYFLIIIVYFFQNQIKYSINSKPIVNEDRFL